MRIGALGRRPSRRFLAPEVIQTSAMDCGPAALHCLLSGFGVASSYERLREACQTGVDGTRLTTLEEVACQLGLEAEQILLPADHLLLPEANALPALLVVVNPLGQTHFVVAWARHGRWVQLMDPASGRRLIEENRLLADLYRHEMVVPAAAWRQWAGSEEATASLGARLAALGVDPARREDLLEAAEGDPGWRGLAALDAGSRRTAALVGAGALRRGREAVRMLGAFLARADQEELSPSPDAVRFASVSPVPPGDDGEERLNVRGTVLVRVRGRASPSAGPDVGEPEAPTSRARPAALSQVVDPGQPSAGRDLLALLRQDGLLRPVSLTLAIGLASLLVVVEALCFRGLLDLGAQLSLPEQRAGAVLVLLLLLGSVLAVELPSFVGSLAAGRRLELRLRWRFLERTARLGDQYFRSRLSSDLAERCHSAHRVRELGILGGAVVRTVFQIVLTSAAVVWLNPALLPLALVGAALGLAWPLFALPVLAERDLRMRSHAGALSRFHLDGLLGLIPLRTHGAERAFRIEHEALLVEWQRALLRRERFAVLVDAAQAGLGYGLVVALVTMHFRSGGAQAQVLLLAYWGLNLQALGQLLILCAQQYPQFRNVAMRLLEPLAASPDADEAGPEAPSAGAEPEAPQAAGVALRFSGVSVIAAGQLIVDEVTAAIPAGSHTAVVGPSGAGKSTLVGLLLGWHAASEGSVLMDGEPLSPARLEALRRDTAWVDPAIRLWNRPLSDNLLYGSSGAESRQLGRAITEARLRELLEGLPEGLETRLGEGGALVSGGEGQRVRFGRALSRRRARLVILDEAFRGLERQVRGELLARAREVWSGATLLVVSHDLEATLGFDQVLVVEAGRLVESGPPALLAMRHEGRYAALLAAERAAAAALSAASWRRLRLEGGGLHTGEAVDGPAVDGAPAGGA